MTLNAFLDGKDVFAHLLTDFGKILIFPTGSAGHTVYGSDWPKSVRNGK